MDGGMRSQQSRPQSVISGAGTFRSALASTRAPQAVGPGPVRRTGVARSARSGTAPYQRPTRPSESVFDRLGGRVDDTPKGTRVRVSDLNHDVMDDDIKELFSGVGELVSCEIDYDRSGRSKGQAMVVFVRREDAELAVSQFHKRTLDGTAMNVEILEGPPPPSNAGNKRSGNVWGDPASNSAGIFASGNRSNRGNGSFSNGSGTLAGRGPQSHIAGTGGAARVAPPRPTPIPNVRAGVFGTALNEVEDDEEMGGYDQFNQPTTDLGGGRGRGRKAGAGGNVQFSVTLGGMTGSSSRAIVDNRGSTVGASVGGFGSRNESGSNGANFLSRDVGRTKGGSGGGGARSGGGGFRSGGGGVGAGRGTRGNVRKGQRGRGDFPRKEVSTVDLDAQLEAHMAKR